MIGIRRKAIFQAGLIVLLIGLVWAAYGFAMRVAITGWAPVTNMYETVIYVPFFVAILGAWFALLPVLWNGLKSAWRMTAAPGTWEAAPLAAEQTRLASPGAWALASGLLLIPRVALSGLVLWVLAIAPYSAGGRTIINLLPNIDAGQRLPDFNDVMTWAVGLTVLVPAVWYIPRVILTALVALVLVPASVRGRRRQAFDQAYARWPFCLAATFIAFFGAAVASYAPVLDSSFGPLQPVLRDNFWLLIHVLTIVSSYGAGALAWGVANLALGYYLFGRYTPPEPVRALGHRPADTRSIAAGFAPRRPPEEANLLSGYVYKAMQVAVVLLAAGTMLGALWADVAWGRFWGWDPKEVWALISLLVYLAILHGRYAGMFGNFGLCFGAVLGFSAIIMSWYGVNFVLGVGLHSYGFGQGGQFEVFGAVALNWLYLAAATVRYLRQTKGTILFWKSFAADLEGSTAAEAV
jgi:ABC-type transport system involved in cytochrome c biogenesis permease subunit